MSYYDNDREKVIRDLQTIADNGETAKKVLTFAQDLLELDAMVMDRANRWNRVEDLLPPEGVQVLAVLRDGDARRMSIAYVDSMGNWVKTSIYSGRVTHWRNLPNFPEV